MRRTALAAPSQNTLPQLGRLTIDRDARRAELEGAEVELTPKEFDLLGFLAERPVA